MNDDDENIFETDRHMLHRTDATDTSIAAAHKVDATTWAERCYDYCLSLGIHGITPREARNRWPSAAYSTITARFSDLQNKGLIFDTGIRRDHSQVLVASSIVEKWAEAYPADALLRPDRVRKKVKLLECPCCKVLVEYSNGALHDTQGDLFDV